jgi:phage terminase large subunit-like protein
MPFFINGVSFDPHNPTSLWAWGLGTSKATFGSTFSAVSPLGSVDADVLWFNPATSGNILVGGDGTGVLQSTNGGSSFTSITNSGLVTPSFTGVGKAGTTIAAALPGNSVPVIVP